MSVTESLWNKLVENLPKGILRRATEDLFCGSVKYNDPLIAIDRDDGIHRGTDYAEQSLLAIPEGRVSLPALRNVIDRSSSPARLIIGR
jgi:hypothetical protein